VRPLYPKRAEESNSFMTGIKLLEISRGELKIPPSQYLFHISFIDD
jgi:hypothetical protein